MLAGLLLASRDIIGGIRWVQSERQNEDLEQLAEKQKKQFAGNEIKGKKLGVIGLGAIGVQVANIATKLGMTVFGYDPFLSVDGALALSRLVHRAMDLETIYKNCDYITLHVPQTAETRGMLNEDAFHMMKGGVRILNLARGGLVNDDDLRVLDRGCTVLHAQTGYTGTERDMLLTVVTNRELAKLNHLVLETDPQAFIVISSVNEVHGRGFTLQKIYK